MENYSQQIAPNRFVYHISYRKSRNSILQNGLKARTNENIGYENAIFAHNCNLITTDWYPFVMDRYEWDVLDEYNWGWQRPSELELLTKAITRHYDIWRIDTSLISSKWFIDNIGQKDFGASLITPGGLYIMTNGSIPKEAITLCCLGTNKAVNIQYVSGWIDMTFPTIKAA